MTVYFNVNGSMIPCFLSLRHFVIWNKCSLQISFCCENNNNNNNNKNNRSTEGSVRPAVVNVLGTGQGQEYSVSVSVQVLKCMYTKWAGTRHNIQKVSDQPGYLQSLIRAFTMRFNGKLKLESNHSDQTARTARLIWVIAGRTGHFVRFVVLTLKEKLNALRFVINELKWLDARKDERWRTDKRPERRTPISRQAEAVWHKQTHYAYQQYIYKMDKGVSRGTGFLSELIFHTEVADNIQIFLAKYQWDNILARWIYKGRHCIIASVNR